MRKLLLTSIVLFAISTGIMAKGITEEKALGIASRFFGSSTRSGESLTVAKSSKGYYAINRGSAKGFVIVAATDNFPSEVLGYSDAGTIDTLAMPANMKWLLAQYDALSETSSVSASTRSTSRAAISPLLTCYWDQDSPFWRYCPTYYNDTCYTGCVATAIAQIMYHHKWPKQGTGSVSYTIDIDGEESRTLTKDFSQSTYDWDSMLDYYSSASSTQAGNAVAQLMADVGYASKMVYGTESSGTYSYNAALALVNYFGYDKTVRLAPRDYYTHDEWDDLLYGELSASRPIYFSGYDKYFTSGHAFVIDGYDDGYYHVNWGWSGVSNGYFLITDLTPTVQGAGGSGAGFSYGGHAIVGIQPPVDGSEETIELCNYASLYLNSRTNTVKNSGQQWFQCYVYSYSPLPHKFTPGLKIVDSEGNATYVKGDNSKTLTMYDNSDSNVISAFRADMSGFPTTKGTYDVYLSCYEKDLGEWIDPRTNVTANDQTHLVATVGSSTITFSDPSTSSDAKLSATDIAISSRVVADTLFYGTVTCTASNGDYYGNIYVGFASSASSTNYKVYGSNVTLVDLGDGESQKLKFTAQAPSKPGTYYMRLLDSSSRSISDAIEVTVESQPEGDVALEAVSISMPSTVDVDPLDVNISFDVKCTSGLFNDFFYAIFWEEGATHSSTYLTSDIVLLVEGDEATISFSGVLPALLYGKTYECAIYGGGGYIKPYDLSGVTFTTAAKSAIDAISASKESQAFSVYTVNGTLVSRQEGTRVDLSSLPKGVYIVKSGAKTFKVVKGR